MKKAATLLLLLVISLNLAFADDLMGLCGDNLYWQYYPNDSTLEIKGYGKMESYDDYSDVPWHFYMFDMRVIKLPQGITSISAHAFEDGFDVREVNIPSSVVSIGERAFAFCHKLFNIEVPANVQSIGKEAFRGVPYISYYGSAYGTPWAASCVNGYLFEDMVFRDMSKTVMVKCNPFHKGIVHVPEQTQKIEEGAFGGCEYVSEIYIPSSVSSIDEKAFYDCGQLTNIHVEDGNISYCSVDGVLFDKNQKTLKCYPADKNGTTYLIPSTVEIIGVYGFYGSKHIRTIDIPEGVRFMHEACFTGCKSLEKVTLHYGLMAIRDYVFHSCSALKSIELPESLCEIGEGAFMNCSSLEKINIPNKIKTIKPYTFQRCSGLTSIFTGENVTKIEENAFSECSGLEHLYTSDNLSVIESRAFHWCDKFKTIHFGMGLRRIGEYAFDGQIKYCNVWCKAYTPPYVSETGFVFWCKSCTKVFVPRSAIGEYWETSPWNKFSLQASSE